MATLNHSVICVYVNGELLGSCNGGPSTVKYGSTHLYLGWDEASGPSAGHFKGAVDEFRLYKEALPQDGIRGLMWFLGGANTVLVPRGVLYDSELFAQMAGNGSALLGGPLAGGTVHGNDNPLSSSLNARVIQMVIDQNLTLADAYEILGLLWTNKTGNVTVFAYPIAGEFYTLGFAWEVSKLVANATVGNSGNYTEVPPPPPPPAWYDVVWNTIVGAAQFVWNAAVAVGTFFVAAVVWLANVFVGVTIGLLTGNWEYFQENVVEPFVEALEALIQFVVNVIRALFDAALNAVLPWFQAIVTWITGIANDASWAIWRLAQRNETTDLEAFRRADLRFWDALEPFVLVSTALSLAMLAIQFVMGPISFVLSLVINVIIDVVAQQIVQVVSSVAGSIIANVMRGDLSGILPSLGLDTQGIRSSALAVGPPVAGLACGLAAVAAILLGSYGLKAWQIFEKVQNNIARYRGEGSSAMRQSAVEFVWGLIFSIFAALFAAAAWIGSDSWARMIVGAFAVGFGIASIIYVEGAYPRGGKWAGRPWGDWSDEFKMPRWLMMLTAIVSGSSAFFGAVAAWQEWSESHG